MIKTVSFLILEDKNAKLKKINGILLSSSLLYSLVFEKEEAKALAVELDLKWEELIRLVNEVSRVSLLQKINALGPLNSEVELSWEQISEIKSK